MSTHSQSGLIVRKHLPSQTEPGWTRAARHLAAGGTTGVPNAAADVAALFAAQAIRTPDAIAVEFGDQRLSYAELASRANRLGRVLRSRGVGPGVAVAISMERSVEMVVAVLGVLSAGGAYVPIDPAYPASRREHMLTDSKAHLVLTQEALAGGFQSQPASLLCLDRDWSSVIGVVADDSLESTTAAGDTGYIIYTSGSTGVPKGVALPQRALLNLITWQIARRGFAPGARVLQFSSLSFDVSFQELFSTWASGGTLVLIDDLSRRDPAVLLERLESWRITRLFLPFVALRSLASAAAPRQRCPTALREVYTAGEQLQVDDTLRAFFAGMPGCALENQYGPSETHVVTAHTMDADPSRWPTLPPIGSPVANCRIVVLNAEHALLGQGQPGEVYISGSCLASGYFGKPELTAARFVTLALPGEGHVVYYRTGDLGEWDQHGELHFRGRIDQQVKFRGYRIEPGEVSAQVAAHPDVAQCIVSVRQRAGLGQRLVAYVKLRPGSDPSPKALHAFTAARLPAHMVPTHFVRAESFPLTPSGKVDLKALPEPLSDRSLLGTACVPPRTTDELALARIWSRLLGFDEVGVRDDFFDLGGDSLLAASMLEDVRAELGLVVTLGTLASAPTIEAFASAIRSGATGSRWRSLVPIRTQGDKVPVFCVHGGLAGVGSFPLLARQLAADQPFYGLQWDGLTGDRGARTIPEMARRYLGEVRSVQPKGPYLLAGHCVGGLVAWEMAKQLRAQGEEVAHLFMLDSPNLNSARYQPGRISSALEVMLRMKKDRRSLAEVWIRSALGIGVKPEHRPILAARVMVRAAWAYRPAQMQIDATAIMTGLSDGRYMHLAGSWDDAAMGWTAWSSLGINVAMVPVEHNEIVHDPATAGAVNLVLEKVQLRLAARATG